MPEVTPPLSRPSVVSPAEGLDVGPIRAREAAATKGPWRLAMSGYSVKSTDDDMPIVASVPGGPMTNIFDVGREPRGKQWIDNADFIAAARQDIPLLLAEISRLRGVSPAVKEELCCGGDVGGASSGTMGTAPCPSDVTAATGKPSASALSGRPEPPVTFSTHTVMGSGTSAPSGAPDWLAAVPVSGRAPQQRLQVLIKRIDKWEGIEDGTACAVIAEELLLDIKQCLESVVESLSSALPVPAPRRETQEP